MRLRWPLNRLTTRRYWKYRSSSLAENRWRLRSGDLYATNGPELSRIVVDEGTMAVWPEGTGITVEFIGQDGASLEKRAAGP